MVNNKEKGHKLVKNIYPPRHQSKQYLRLGAYVLNCGRSGTNLTSKHIVEHLGNILLAFKVNAV